MYRDITGQRFGRLIAISPIHEKGNRHEKHKQWMCECDCGGRVIVDNQNLVRGNTTSCGCYNKEVISLPYGENGLNQAFAVYRRQAKSRGLSFELSKEEFRIITKGNCFYCGCEPNNVSKGSTRHNGAYIYNGIDRVDNSTGYIIDNCVPCCKICNGAKGKLSQKEFFNWIKRVYANHKITQYPE